MTDRPSDRAISKLHIGGVDPDKERCLRCGSWYLGTGWECNDCGYDNQPHYVEPKGGDTNA